jgi:hypothetical protein
MLSLQAAQNKLLGNVIATFSQSAYLATSILDLQTASKLMFE